MEKIEVGGRIKLPEPIYKSNVSVEEALSKRRSIRTYSGENLRFVHMEAGHAAQNVYLQVVSLDLGTFVIGAFIDDKVKEILNADEQEEPLYITPVGRKG